MDNKLKILILTIGTLLIASFSYTFYRTIILGEVNIVGNTTEAQSNANL